MIYLTWYFTLLPGGGTCWADCSSFLPVGWHPRRNYAYQILSRSHQGFGATGVQNLGFPIHFWTALTTVLRTAVLRCDNSGVNQYQMCWKNQSCCVISLIAIYLWTVASCIAEFFYLCQLLSFVECLYLSHVTMWVMLVQNVCSICIWMPHQLCNV